MDQTPQNSLQTSTQPLTKAEFNQKYWFNSLQLVTVVNPLAEDWPFMVEMRHFQIGAGKTEKFPGVIANVYLDIMSKILAQNDEKLAYMSDPALMRLYYDKLIIDVENLAPEVNNEPAYLKDVAPGVRMDAPNERPPWDASQGERARDVAPTPSAPAPEPALKTVKEPKAETKEFEFQGAIYKMIVDKNEKAMFYKDGRLTSSAEYQRAASLL